MRVSPFSFHLCGDSLFNVHAALLTMCAAVMPYRHFTELKRRIFHPVRWCYFIRYTDKSKSCFAFLCCFCACFQALSPLLPCENCKNTENKEIFTFSGKCYTKNKRTFCAIWRLDCPALAIKNFNRFPLCYYYIESMRFCQVFTESFTFPNMTDCTNTKRMVHSERPGHSKHSRQPSRRFFRRRPYIPAPESWPSALIFRQRKVEGYRLYCVAGKLKAAEEWKIYIYIMYISPPFSHESVQPRNRRTRNQTGIRQATRWGRHWAQYEAPSRPQMRL